MFDCHYGILKTVCRNVFEVTFNLFEHVYEYQMNCRAGAGPIVFGYIFPVINVPFSFHLEKIHISASLDKNIHRPTRFFCGCFCIIWPTFQPSGNGAVGCNPMYPPPSPPYLPCRYGHRPAKLFCSVEHTARPATTSGASPAS